MTDIDNNEPHWVCLSINQNFVKDDLVQTIKSEMDLIFGPDILDMEIMCDKLSKEHFEMNVENYLFVKVQNYFEHVRALKESNVIFGVLDSYDTPCWITEAEVYKFRDSLKNKLNEEALQEGNLVQVKEGYLKGLKGVVLEHSRGERYKVFFKFHTYSKTETMWRKNLVYVSNIFDIDFLKSRYQQWLRNPKTNENILCRKKLRKHKRQKPRRHRVGK